MKFDPKGYLYAGVDLETENIAVGSIVPNQEFRFMFLRLWTLYNSIYYSNYVVTRLRTWQELGKRELLKFFAMLGIPADEYNQQYKFMNTKYKEILRDKIPEIAPKFNLDNILFSSFVRQIDNKTQINASDMVYAVTSLLESPRSVMTDNIPNCEDSKNEEMEEKALTEEEKDMLLNHKHTHEIQIENFWAAYESLDIKNKAYINYGIILSKEMQQAIMSQGTSLISSKKVTPCSKFRYCIINNDSLAETKIFQYPLAIQKLALFIMDAYKESKAIVDELPMIL